MKELAGEAALVTGAGSGIGRATALALASQGVSVAVSDLDPEAAQATAEAISASGGQAADWPLDVSDFSQFEFVLGELSERFGVPSILVNNAGIGVGGEFLDTSLESWQRVVSVNLMGVVHGCRAVLPAMIESGRPGHVVNIASMAGFAAAAKVSAYSATKFGVLGFSEALRAEMVKHRIGVSAICPGIIHTNIINASTLASSTEDVEAKRESLERFYRRRNYGPERVAAVILRAIRNNRAVVPVTPEAWSAYYFKRWAPWLIRWLAQRDPF